MGIFTKLKKPEHCAQDSLSTIDLASGSAVICGLRIDAFTPYCALAAMKLPRVIESVQESYWLQYRRHFETPVLLDDIVFDKVLIDAKRSNTKDAILQYPVSICFETKQCNVLEYINGLDMNEYGGRQITDSQYHFPWGVLWVDDISIRFAYRMLNDIPPAGPRCGIFNLQIGEGKLEIEMLSSYSDMVAKMHRDTQLIGHHSSPRFMVHENQPKYMSTMKFENVQFQGMHFAECLVYADAGIISKIVFGDGQAGKSAWSDWARKEFALDIERPVFEHYGNNYMEYPYDGHQRLGVSTYGHNLEFAIYEHSNITEE